MNGELVSTIKWENWSVIENGTAANELVCDMIEVNERRIFLIGDGR